MVNTTGSFAIEQETFFLKTFIYPEDHMMCAMDCVWRSENKQCSLVRYILPPCVHQGQCFRLGCELLYMLGHLMAPKITYSLACKLTYRQPLTLVTLTRWAILSGDWNTIHSSTAITSWPLSFWMEISPPKNNRQYGETSVQSYK